MERNSPLLQAVRSSYDDMDYVVDEGRDNVKTGDITAVMSYDQMSHLLTLMVTISVISILILIFSVTVILGFLWYTRNLLNRKCGCSNLHEPLSTNINIPVYQHHQLMSSGPHPVIGGSGGGHVVGHVGHVPRVAVQDKIYRANKNVTVNPLPPPKIYNTTNQFGLAGSPRRNLVPSINPSIVEQRCLDNSISSSDYEINHRGGPDTLTDDPIYAEIKAKDEKKEETRDCLKSNSELVSKQNLSEQGEHQEVASMGKKEIEYWQITAKEVVKFRPCTETFIVRE